MNTQLVRELCPYPTIGEKRELIPGYLLDHPKQCKKCKHRNCYESLNPVGYVEGVTHFVCEKGMSVFDVAGSEYRLLINGVLDTEQNHKCTSDTRKSLRSHKLLQRDVELWTAHLSSAVDLLKDEVDHRVEQVVSGLHDVQTAVTLVYRNAEALVVKNEGDSFAEKVDSADPKLKDLLQSVALLTTRFVASSIVTNPESASYGKKRSCPVYKLFHKMIRLFEGTAAKKNVRLWIEGTSFNRVHAYDSIEALALVLVDNAVKYSSPGGTAHVSVNDENDGIYVVVESEGPIVRDEDCKRIFEKGHRTEAAKEMVRTGSGLGLYIANCVAEAHGSSIRYKSREVGTTGRGTNVFSIKFYFSEHR